MPVLALTTCAIFLQRPGTNAMRGFFDRAPATIGAASGFADYVPGSTRFHVHSRGSFDAGGGGAHPRYYRPESHGGIACTVSLWRSVESAFAYSYSGAHAEALAHRAEWFAKGDWPQYAAWWASGDDSVPSFADAAARLDHLHAEGSTPFAFDFKAPYDAAGACVTVDRERVKRLIDLAQSHSHVARKTA